MALLEVKGLVKHFGGLLATNHVDLSVEAGSVFSIIGPNGAGKSTLLNQLIGHLTPDEGSIEFDGHALIGMAPHNIHQLGIERVFQSPEVYPQLSLVDNATISALAARDGAFSLNVLQHPKKRRQTVEQAEFALQEVGLYERRFDQARDLSRGDKRRLELAVCLAHEPKLLLLDEPTAGMSQHETGATVDLLTQLTQKTTMACIIIEHDMKLVFSLSERIAVLHQGTIIANGSPDEIRSDKRVLDAYLGGVEDI